jgi:DNA-binding XRE family transcriptional regulator
MIENNILPQRIRLWRRVNAVGQKDLAARLGVTQQAVSNWETGRDTPSQLIISKLMDLFSNSDELSIEKAFIRSQSTVRALIDVDGATLVGYSSGFERVWKEFCSLSGVALEDKLINELYWISSNVELRREIMAGEVPILSGTSNKHLDVDLGVPFKHRWHICFRRYGARKIADMIYEPCDADAEVGVQLGSGPINSA